MTKIYRIIMHACRLDNFSVLCKMTSSFERETIVILKVEHFAEYAEIVLCSVDIIYNHIIIKLIISMLQLKAGHVICSLSSP